MTAIVQEAKYQQLQEGHRALVCGVAGVGIEYLLLTIGKLYQYNNMDELKMGYKNDGVSRGHNVILDSSDKIVGVSEDKFYSQRIGIYIPTGPSDKIVLGKWDEMVNRDPNHRAVLDEEFAKQNGLDIREFVQDYLAAKNTAIHYQGDGYKRIQDIRDKAGLKGQILNRELSQRLFDFQIGQGIYQR